MKWQTIQLGEVMDVKHGYAFDGEFFTDSGKYVLLTPGNCHETGGLKLRGEKEKYYVGEFPSEYLLAENDMLVVMTDLVNTAPILGGSLLIPENDRFLHNQRLGLVQITNEDLIDKGFLYYLLNTYNYRAQIRGSASGATVRHTAPSRIKSCTVRVPLDIGYQKKVAGALAAYDSLMRNNRDRMRLLENAVRLLYREWFVYFHFPGHAHIKVTDGVPDGWRRVPLSSLCTDIRELIHPSNVTAGTRYIGLEHIPRRSITLGEWGCAEDVTSSKFRFQAGDILFGKIRPYFHKVGLALTDGITSSDAIVIRPIEEKVYAYCLCLVSSDAFVALASKTVREGSKMPRADWKYLQRQQFLLPADDLLYDFTSVISPVLQQLRTLALQTRRLTEARNILLPRLMTGEVEL
jgi:type I restriction enzyme S subunit